MAELIAKRYALSMFEVGLELDNTDKYYDDLKLLDQELKSNDKLFEILKHPRITKIEKKSMLKEIFGKNMSQEVLNFLYVIIDKRREDNIPLIIKEYKQLLNKHNNVINVEATTSIAMKKRSKKKLKKALEKKLNKNIEISNKVDPSIIGGVLLKMDDKIIDSTLTSQLKNMEKLVTNISL